VELAQQQGVDTWLQGGIDPSDWDRQQALATKHPGVWPCFGLHPWWVASHSLQEVRAALDELAHRLPEAVALGETGLDFSSKHAHAKMPQLWAFQFQLQLAKRLLKPLVLHVVHAHGPALEILEKEAPFPAGGLVHGFSGDGSIAKRYLAKGFLLSVGGSLLRPGFTQLKKALSTIPPQSVVVETDAPDGVAAPGGLVEVARAVAHLQGRTAEEVLETSSRNLRTWLKT
jgi:TatD DNase family protein